MIVIKMIMTQQNTQVRWVTPRRAIALCACLVQMLLADFQSLCVTKPDLWSDGHCHVDVAEPGEEKFGMEKGRMELLHKGCSLVRVCLCAVTYGSVPARHVPGFLKL